MSPLYPPALRAAFSDHATVTVTISNQPKFSVWERQHQTMFGSTEHPKKIVVHASEASIRIECFTAKKSFTTHHGKESLDEILTELWGLNFGQWLVQSADSDLQILQNKGKVSVRNNAATKTTFQTENNRKKNHILDAVADRVLLDALQFVTADGSLLSSHVHKFKQINHLVGIVVQDSREMSYTIVDAGCGKAYMSIALAYAFQKRGIDVEVIGVDNDPHVIEVATAMAQKAGIKKSVFIASDLGAVSLPVPTSKNVILLALHACNTATDDAIALGVTLSAAAMYVAPCCHNHIQQQMKPSTAPETLKWMLDDGIIKERLADLVTDTLRRDILRAYNYDAHIQEFVAAEHTTKNLLLRALQHSRQPETAITEQRLQTVQQHAAIVGVRPVLFDLLHLP